MLAELEFVVVVVRHSRLAAVPVHKLEWEACPHLREVVLFQYITELHFDARKIMVIILLVMECAD